MTVADILNETIDLNQAIDQIKSTFDLEVLVGKDYGEASTVFQFEDGGAVQITPGTNDIYWFENGHDQEEYFNG